MRNIESDVWIRSKHFEGIDILINMLALVTSLCGGCSGRREYKEEDLVSPPTWMAFGLGRGTWSEIALGQHKMVLQVHLLEMRVILLQSREHIPTHETY